MEYVALALIIIALGFIFGLKIRRSEKKSNDDYDDWNNDHPVY